MVEQIQSHPDLPTDFVKDAIQSFDAVDEDQRGYIQDKDHIYALFLSLAITFQSEEEFLSTISRAIDESEEGKEGEEEKKEEEIKTDPANSGQTGTDGDGAGAGEEVKTEAEG